MILSGGSTLYEGLPERLKKELEMLAPPGMEINIVAPHDRNLSVWKGGSMICSLDKFADSWVTKDEYDENGAEIVLSKCA